MSEKTFKVKNGDEIIIRVPGRKSQPVGTSKPVKRKGIVRARRADDFLPRRLKKTDVLINIYDLGHIKDPETGIFHDIDFFVIPDIDFAYESYSGFPIRELDADDLATIEDTVFDIPFDDWKERFRKLTPENGEKYQLSVNGDDYDYHLQPGDANWTEDGLKITRAEIDESRFVLEHFTPYPAFHTVALKRGEQRNRITTTRDAEAPDVGFFPSAEMDIYLMPNAFVSSGNASRDTPSPKAYLLNCFYALLPRDVVLNEDSQWYRRELTGNYSIDGSETEEKYDEALNVVNFHKSLDPARAFESVVAEEFTETALSDFPPPSVTYPPAGGGFFDATFYNLDPAVHFISVLIAVVHKQGVWFYVWSDYA